MPLFSIVIPLYNTEKYIRACLESLTAQTFTDYEIVVVNDGSTDGGPAIVQEFIEQNPKLHIRLIKQKNKGLGAARNAGIEEANGHWITLLDADDLFERDKLRRLNECIEKNPKGKWIMHAATELYMPSGHRRKRFFRRAYSAEELLVKGNPFLPSASCIEKKLLMAFPFDEHKNCEEDLDLWLRLFNNGYSPIVLNEKLTVYRIHPESITASLNKHLEKVFVSLKRNIDEPALLQKAICRKYYEAGRVLQRKGSFQKAAEFYQKSRYFDVKTSLIRLLNFIKVKI